MANQVQTTSDIYDLVQDLLDGDEFQSDEAALRSMNAKYDKLLSERDWYFLNDEYEMQLTNLLFSQITDLDRVLRIWYKDAAGSVSEAPLREAPFIDRFNKEYDYYIDEKNKKVVLINEITTGSLLVDYKYKPLPLAFTSVDDVETDTPVIPVPFRPIIALAMVHDFKKADEAQEMFREHGFDEEALQNAMIDDHNAHVKYYA